MWLAGVEGVSIFSLDLRQEEKKLDGISSSG